MHFLLNTRGTRLAKVLKSGDVKAGMLTFCDAALCVWPPFVSGPKIEPPGIAASYWISNLVTVAAKAVLMSVEEKCNLRRQFQVSCASGSRRN
jgi:hypothetical protein